MIFLSQSTSRWAARTSMAMVALSILAFGAWTAGGLFGQPPAQKKQRTEEEEAPKNKKPKRKVIPDEDQDPKASSKAATPRPTRPAAGGDLAQLAEQASHVAVKELFRSLAVSHDWALYKPSQVTVNGEKKQREEKIKPIRLYLGNNPERHQGENLRVTPLKSDGKADKPHTVDPIRLESVRCYEEIAQDKVRRFLRESHERLSRTQMLDAAEQALSAVLDWHRSAIQTGERSGKEWDDVEKALRKQLLDEVCLEKMTVLAEAKDWDGVLELTHRLAVAYGKDANQKRIFQPVANMIQQGLRNAVDENAKQQARERLHKLEIEFPDNPAFNSLRDMLRQHAQNFLDEAKKQRTKNDAAARGFLERAKKTWPHLEGLREFENELNNDSPVLRVGMRGLPPKYFSPAWACTDNERRAVEMLFESLVKRVPDQAGGLRYRRGLAEFAPKVVPLGRLFRLPREAYWSDRRRLDSSDVIFSLDLLQRGKGVGRSRRWGELLTVAEANNDSSQVMMRLKQGFLDPLAAMTFKILPGSLPDNVRVYDEAFALNPVTSGPFLLGPEKSDEEQRPCRFFTVNPFYGIRPSKRYKPHIQEVRFYCYDSNTDMTALLANDQLDLVLDLTAKEVQSLLNKQSADIRVHLPSPSAPNRRIYFLAVNTSKLDDAALRRALSCAIDREGLLNKYFRGSLKVPLHKALSGPFPVGSWACERDNRADKSSRTLFDRDGAMAWSKNAKAGPFTLKYASDNPALDAAMKELCAQVKELTGVELAPAPCDPYRLRADVEQTQDYDLAYYHYDFPDESYWLAPLFGPPPRGESHNNIFKYDNNDLSVLMARMKNYRGFDRVRRHQRSIEEFLNGAMPLVPLWQLDPLLAYRGKVQPAALDPLLLFGNIEDWRMQRK